jgi:hypothetical protein
VWINHQRGIVSDRQGEPHTVYDDDVEYVLASRYNELREAAEALLTAPSCGGRTCCEKAKRHQQALADLRAALEDK